MEHRGANPPGVVHVASKPAHLAQESLGDWCGFKGAAYHLTVAVWLLLKGKASEVAFYAGNDVLAQPVIPPEELGDADGGIHVSQREADEWIQVKAHEEPWTRSALLAGNLLRTFILNALLSEKRGRQWVVTLATTSPVRSAGIEEFLTNRQRFPKLNGRFETIVEGAHRAWSRYTDTAGPGSISPSAEYIRQIGVQAVTQLATSRPRDHALLTAEIQVELISRFHDRDTAKQAGHEISGAVLKAISERREPFNLSIRWLERETGLDLQPDDQLSSDIVRACRTQVERASRPDWSVATCAQRLHAKERLDEFLLSDRCLFVLTGESGSGKSWFVTQFALDGLRDKVRAVISGTDLLKSESLASMVAKAFEKQARAHASHQEIWRRLAGAAKAVERGSFVVIADDLPASEDPIAFTNRLEQLCREAHEEGIKLVLVARPRVWQRLWDAAKLSHYLHRHSGQLNEFEQSSDGPPESYRMPGLSREELRDILERTLPHNLLSYRLLRQLREPRFVALRNPYLLSAYIRNIAQQLRSADCLPDPDVDSLLDKEIVRRFTAVAQRAGLEPGEVGGMKDNLVRSLWEHRATGASFAKIVDAIEARARGLGRRVLDALQIEDVLTTSGDPRSPGGNLTYANPQFGDRLNALLLWKRIDDGIDVLGELRPGVDDGVMTALLRSASTATLPDVLSWGEQALDRNADWLGAISEGIAQRGLDDWRVLAGLTSWANRSEGFSTWNAMRALGGMAGRSARARYWIACLYSDEHYQQHFKGEIALGRALDIVPRWVERRLRVRVRRELAREPSRQTEDRDRVKFLRSALEPLRFVANSDAAIVGRSVLTWIQQRYRPARPERELDVREHLEDKFDYIRGRIAVYSQREEIGRIVSELEQENEEVRLRAARALVPIAEESPESVRKPIFCRARVEERRLVLLHLFRSLHFYMEGYPADVVAFAQSPGARAALGCSGSVLGLLAPAARKVPVDAKAALQGLPQAHPERAAVNSELLAFAWWNYASVMPDDRDARKLLEMLSVPDYGEIDARLRPFVARAAAVATFALIALDDPALCDAATKATMYFHPLALETGEDVLHVDLTPIALRFPDEIVQHALGPKLISLLVESLQQYKKHEAHPIDYVLNSWQFRIANLCADWLAALAPKVAECMRVVEQLPDDWPALRICRGLLEASCASAEIIQHGLRICSEHTGEISNITTDRDRFLSVLATRGLLPAGMAFPLRGESFAAGSDVTRVDTEMKLNPERTFELLHGAVNRDNAVSFLWQWSCESANWRAVLLGHVHRSCFHGESFSIGRCRELCRMVLEASRGVAADPLGVQNVTVFGTLEQFAAGGEVELPNLSSAMKDFLSQSQQSAIALLATYLRAPAQLTNEWFYTFISNAAGWVEDMGNWVEYGSVVFGSGLGRGTVHFPPALRIALAVVSQRCGMEDFGSRWIRERAQVRRLVSDVMPRDWIYGIIRERELNESEKGNLSANLAKIEAQETQTPWHADLWWVKGHLQLLLGEFAEARVSLTRSLQAPARICAVERSAHYDLSCVYGRLGEHEACRRELTVALDQGFRISREQLTTDPDLASVREDEWYKKIVEAMSS